jgi:hypothetical protein
MKTRFNQQRSTFPYRYGSIPALIGVAVGLIAGSANAAVVTFTSTRDNTITNFVGVGPSDYSNTNFGGVDNMSVGYLINGTQKSLVGFTLNDPGLATALGVNSVKLRLYLSPFTIFQSAPSSFNNRVYAITGANSGWLEGNGMNFGDTPGSTWNSAWASPGLAPTTDYDTAYLSEVVFNPSSLPSSGTAVDFSFSGTSAQLTTLIQNWEVSMPGLLLQTSTSDPNPTANSDRITWYTRQATNPAFAPQLIVDYTPVPEPSSCLLLMVGGGFLCPKRRR